MILLLKSYPYHFVRTILSVPFCPIPFCPYTILSIPFCPYHFVRYHFVLEPFIHVPLNVCKWTPNMYLHVKCLIILFHMQQVCYPGKRGGGYHHYPLGNRMVKKVAEGRHIVPGQQSPRKRDMFLFL